MLHRCWCGSLVYLLNRCWCGSLVFILYRCWRGSLVLRLNRCWRGILFFALYRCWRGSRPGGPVFALDRCWCGSLVIILDRCWRGRGAVGWGGLLPGGFVRPEVGIEPSPPAYLRGLGFVRDKIAIVTNLSSIFITHWFETNNHGSPGTGADIP